MRFHRIVSDGETVRIQFTPEEEAAADADEAETIERQTVVADRAAELSVLHAKLAASEDLTQAEINRMLALERQS